MKISNFSAIFTLCKVIKWAGLDPLVGQFWPSGRMFDTPVIWNNYIEIANLLM